MSSLKQTTKPGLNAKSLRPVGFISKDNTCCANSILQILSVIPTLWKRVPSESNTLSPMLRVISLNMVIKKNSNKPVDPSNFLWVLKRKLKGVSLVASQLISNTKKSQFLVIPAFASLSQNKILIF